MKRLTIFNENSAPSILFDDDISVLEEYCADVEKIFLSNKVSTLHCTSGSIVLRPSKLTKILVEECCVEEKPVIKQPVDIKPKSPLKTEKKPPIEEDMIIED